MSTLLLLTLLWCYLIMSNAIFGKLRNILTQNKFKIKSSYSNIIKSCRNYLNSIELSSTSTRVTTNNNIIVLSPFLLFLLSTTECNASPLNKQIIKMTSPFFQGWLIRMIDHQQLLSFIFIVGSFSASESDSYDEHYVFCGINSPDLHEQMEHFPEPEIVNINSGRPTVPYLAGQVANITWSAAGHGHFSFTEESCEAEYKFLTKSNNNGGTDCIELQFRTSERISWGSDSRNYLDGPEGWLTYTTLLPCHYFVHSVGSPCTYSITCHDSIIENKNDDSIENLERDITQAILFQDDEIDDSNVEEDSTVANPSRAYSGHGFAHIEGNHGTFFPEGWVWSQSIAQNNTASFSLVAGKFVIGKIAPINCVFYLRRANGKIIIFRTTDMASVRYDFNSLQGTIAMRFESLYGDQRVELNIRAAPHSSNGVSATSFGIPIHVPTPTGFSNSPGCRETYTAVANVKFYSQKPKLARYWSNAQKCAGLVRKSIVQVVATLQYLYHTAIRLVIRNGVTQSDNVNQKINKESTLASAMMASINIPTAAVQWCGNNAAKPDQTDTSDGSDSVEEYEFPLTALEYGGSFIGRVMRR